MSLDCCGLRVLIDEHQSTPLVKEGKEVHSLLLNKAR